MRPNSPIQSEEIRESFLSFFAAKDHLRLPSSSLVPQGDPTLLFTNAGMVQFKDVFLGQRPAPYPRATTAQKCVRAGGKHNDLDNVGHTARHHTFFEMLGNFSFGDYFKEEAIAYAWEYVTQVLGLDKERLWVTVYREDQEARRIWQQVAGLAPERIVAMGEKDNFWAMGDTGPCGPSTEIHFDRGPQYRCQAPQCGVGQCDCDRYFEIWNLVFMQYNREASGELAPLPRPSVDTGMGLERVASILQGVASDFDTDLFLPLIEVVEKMSGRSYSDDPKGFAFRVVADHARACTFLISDGVLPSNEGRGYVLRRILRRAVRYGKKLDIQDPFLAQVSQAAIQKMAPIYPELSKNRDFILKVISLEESRFEQTLSVGLELLELELGILENMAETVSVGVAMSGEVAFVLYDTYGFPLELTREIAAEQGLTVDEEGFRREMEKQRERARAASKFQAREHVADVYQALSLLATAFVGYERLTEESPIIQLLSEGQPVDSVSQGQEAEVITVATPFYPEGGGQVGDTGEIRTATGLFAAEDTQRPIPGLIAHRGRVAEGYISVGDVARLQVDAARRLEMARHHTATHLLHAALRKVVGSHVQQSGSLVTFNRLRFDFSHIGQVSREELDQVERLVNQVVREDLPVTARVTSYREAVEEGALAFFGEKYGDQVRVVTVGEDGFFSKELCGGTHLRRTGEIGLCHIVSEGSIGSGLRRIEAVVGAAAEEMLTRKLKTLEYVASRLGAASEDLEAKVQALLEERERASQEIKRLSGQLAEIKARELQDQARAHGLLVGATSIIVAEVPERSLGPLIQEYFHEGGGGSALCIIASGSGNDIYVGGSVSPDLAGRLSILEPTRRLARELGGGAGGRSDWAQGGGKDRAELQAVLAQAQKELKETLTKGPGG